MFDVLVSGGGPAGAVAAIVAARTGARVLLLDRATFPRDKLCGDTLNPGALAVLRRLGLAGAFAGGLPIDGMIVTGEPAIRVMGRYGDAQGRSIRRRDFDAALLSAAARAGVRIEERTLVDAPVLDTSGAAPVVIGLAIKGRDSARLRVAAPIVIAADGRYSRVARALGLSRSAGRPRRWAVGAYFHDVEGMTSFGEMHVRRGHYIGVAPLPGGLTNACLVTSRLARGPLEDVLRDALYGDPQLRERFAHARMCSPPVCLGPLAVECDVGGAPGLLLAGDAAGFVDPMTGDGLRFALRGGELAGIEALRALEHGAADAHVRLFDARRREFARKWRFNRSLRALVGSPGAVRAAGVGAAISPAVLQHVIRYAGDLHAA